MLFPASVIDGLVHRLEYRQLQKECSSLKQHKFAYAYRNQQTSADISSAGGKELKLEYDNITAIYNYPPLITQEIQRLLGINSVSLDDVGCRLLSSYRHSFDMAFGSNDHYRASAQSHWTRRKQVTLSRKLKSCSASTWCRL
jgi:hypothetical protein